MVNRLFVAGVVLALILKLGDAIADPQPEPMLIPPVSPACISSPFGPRVLAVSPALLWGGCAGLGVLCAIGYRAMRDVPRG